MKPISNQISENESILTSISANLPDGMIYRLVTTDKGDRKFTYLGGSFQKIYGRTPEEGMADPSLVFGRVLKEDVQSLLEAEAESKRNLSTYRCEVRMKNPDGTIRFSRFVSTPKVMADGSLCWDGLELDITDLKKAEADLQRSNFLLQSISDGSPDIVFAKDLDGRFLFANSELAKRTHLSQNELLGKTDFDIFPPDQAGKKMEMDLEIIKSGKTHTYEEQLAISSGNIVFLTTKGPIKDAEGKIIGLFGIAVDITELKKSQADLKKSQFLMQSITDGLPDSIFAKDLNGNFTFVNSALTKRFNKSTVELLGNDIGVVFSPEVSNIRKAMDIEILKDGKTRTFEEIDETPSGSIVYLATKGAIKDELGNTIGLFGIDRDITALKKTQDELQKSQFLLQSITDGLPDSIFAKDLNGRFIFVNSAVEKRANMSLEDLLGKDNSVMFPPDQAKKTWEMDLEVMKSGKIQTFEETLTTPLGSLVNLTTKGPIKDAQGKTVGLFGIARDITELKKAQADLKQSQFLLQSITEGSPDSIFAKDLSGRYLFVNTAFAKRLYKKPEELIGKNNREVISLEQANKATAMDLEVIESENTITVENELTIASGEIVVLITKGPIKDTNGKVVGIFGITRDITESKRAQEALRVSQEKFEFAFNSSPNAILIQDMLTKKYTEVNVSNEKIFGYSPEEVVGKTSVELNLYKDPKAREKVMGIFNEQGYVRNEEVVGRHASGSDLHLLLTVQRNYINGNPYMYIDLQDVTERKTVELELQKLNLDKDRFMSILGHDLRGPVNSIVSLIDLMHDNLADMEMDEIKEIIDLVHQSAKSTSKLMDDVLLWSTAQSGKMKFNPELINFKEKSLGVVELLKSVAEAKNIAIELHCEDSLEVYADRNMLGTVLRNLLSNALKFTRTEGKITLVAQKNEERTVVSIADNGVGIAADDIDKIFDKSQLFTSIGTNEEKGTGFGLKLCQEFVEKHGGEIWVESEVGKRTTFYFSLPYGLFMPEYMI
jgi:PAS domain S-box-containing protein